MGGVSIALCQPRIETDKTTNLIKAAAMIGRAAGDGAEIIALPEMFNCPYDQARFPEWAEDRTGPTLDMLRQAAADNRTYLIGGSFPERDGNQIYNSCYVMGPDGDILAVHRKLHLFDVELSEGVRFQESATISPGNGKTLVRLGRITVGIGICYDLRFPEYARLLALEGAEMIIYPGAFNPVTGPAHWELLLRARAVDNQVFTTGVSGVPGEGVAYRSYGHSMIVDPWGDRLAAAGDGEGIVRAELDLEALRRVRNELPLLQHRRVDLYQVNGIGRWEGAGDKF